MVLRRKMCVVVVATAILFLMIASQTISPSLFLSLSLSLATPAGQAPPASRTTPQPLGPSGHPGPSLPHRHDNIGEGARGEGPEGVGLEGEGSPHAEGSQPGGEASAVLPGPGRTNDKDQSEASSKAVVTPEPPRPSGAQGRSDRMCGCTESCVSELDGSAWFKQRFDPHQQPLLHNSNKMDASALKWWLGLQRSDGQTLEEVMSKLFRVISPPSVDIRPRPSRCHSCAVVGNSGNLRQSGHGSLINTHNSVIRMNKAITAGFEQDVGNRTTHHFLYPESAVDIASGVSLVLLPFKLRDLEWLASALSTGEIKMTYMRVKDRVQADKDKVLVVNPEFFKYTHDNWTEHHGRYPSTGLLAIVFALHICDQVSVFGYGADSEGNWHHYWEENRYAGAFRKTGVHSADFETEVIHRLAKEGKIHLYPSVV